MTTSSGLPYRITDSKGYPFVHYEVPSRSEHEMQARASSFRDDLAKRRSVRHFSDRPVPAELIRTAVASAASAPPGAHLQPWTFVTVSDFETRHAIRIAAEKEEQENYDGGRMPPQWREVLEPLGTDADKSFYDRVPWIVVVFEQRHGYFPDGSHKEHYYVKESVGIACGMFVAAIHNMGLATLTHTPSPMRFLTEILGRPNNESPYLVFPVGYPAEDAYVPEISRKPLPDVLVEFGPRKPPDDLSAEVAVE